MSDIEYSEKLKILRKTFKEFNKENGFRFVKPTIILKEKNNILQYITFHFGYNRLVPEVVIQPLYIPAEGYSPMISSRLNFLDLQKSNPQKIYQRILLGKFEETDFQKYNSYQICKRFPWGACNGDTSEFVKDMQEILDVISKKGLAWFERFDSPLNIINTVNEGALKYSQGFNITLQKEIQALSYWYLGDIDNGVKALKEAQATSDPRSNWFAIYQQWIDFIEQHPERLSFEFEKTILQTKEKLKLSK